MQKTNTRTRNIYMLLSMPYYERERIQNIKNFVYIPQSYRMEQQKNNRTSIFFTTYHPTNDITIHWTVNAIGGIEPKTNIYAKIRSNIENRICSQGDDSSIETHYANPDNYLYQYNIENALITEPIDIINRYIKYIEHTQTDQHFTQFLVACAALQSCITQANNIPPYIAITMNDAATNIYTTHNINNIAIPHTKIPSTNIIFNVSDIDDQQTLHTHNIDPQHNTLVQDIFGPWHHPTMNANIAETIQGNKIEYTPRLYCDQWLTSYNFMPPQWPGCPNLHEKSPQQSHHEWIQLQRIIHNTAKILHPIINTK